MLLLFLSYGISVITTLRQFPLVSEANVFSLSLSDVIYFDTACIDLYLDNSTKDYLIFFLSLTQMEQFTIGAFSAVCACIVTNPLEVVKTRFQLQGELKAKGHHAVHYKGFFHALFTIAKTDGLLALQKGLVPSVLHQIFMNGFRLGGFHLAEERKLHLNSKGEVSLARTAVIAGTMGAITAYTGSPFFLLKVQLQAKSSESIAVGTQHNIRGIIPEFQKLFKTHGVQGLWRGVVGSVPRRIVGSTSQLVSFTFMKEILANNEYYKIQKGYLNAFISSLIGGAVTTVLMNPLDTISTRLYNQGVDKNGRGLLYSSYLDCVKKIYLKEGFYGFYKGIVPLYIRTGPQTVLVLVIWDSTKDFVSKLRQGND